MFSRNVFLTLGVASAVLASGSTLADTVIVVPSTSTTITTRYDGPPPYDVVTSPRYDVVSPRYTYRYDVEPTVSNWVPGYWSWNSITRRNEWHEGRYVVVDRDYAYAPRYDVPDYAYNTYAYNYNTYYAYAYPPYPVLPRAHWEGGR